MSLQGSRDVVIDIDRKLESLSHKFPALRIRKVNEPLRNKNPKAFEPQVVAIGPYHRDKENLKITEEVKLMYLRGILERLGEKSVERYFTAITKLEEKARSLYEGPISMGKEDFVEMLLLDGCFVIEFLRKVIFEDWRDENDIIFIENWILKCAQRDLILLENQVPFFVLVELFRMTTVGDSKDNIVSHVIKSLDDLSPDQYNISGQEFIDGVNLDDVDHILGLTYRSWCSPIPSYNKLKKDSKWQCIKSATELQEAGIKLKKAKKGESRCWLDIKFDHGVLEIPPLSIDYTTEDILRNLIAYEEQSFGLACEKKYIVSDYITFMDSLIDTSKDVENLRHYRIIDNWMGDCEKVATMVNNLGQIAFFNPGDFLYSNIFIRINNHYGRRRNIWLANLRRNYFNTPWSVISFFAALVLLIFTTLQTVYTILAYKQQ